jgi:hypothetical protein
MPGLQAGVLIWSQLHCGLLSPVTDAILLAAGLPVYSLALYGYRDQTRRISHDEDV